LHTLAEAALLAEDSTLLGAEHHTAVSDCGLKPNALKIPQKDILCPESMQIQLPRGSKVLFGHCWGAGACSIHTTPSSEEVS